MTKEKTIQKLIIANYNQKDINDYITNNYNFQYLGVKSLFYKGGTCIKKVIVTFSIYKKDKILTKRIKNETNIKKYCKFLEKKGLIYTMFEKKQNRFIIYD